MSENHWKLASSCEDVSTLWRARQLIVMMMKITIKRHYITGMWRPLVSVITTLLCSEDYFSSSSVVSRAFSALCVYSKYGHHPHLRCYYLCVKFRFFCGLCCWASPRRKIAYSITHPAYLMPREPKLALRNTQKCNFLKILTWLANWLFCRHRCVEFHRKHPSSSKHKN